MRQLTITRDKSFAACLAKMKIYIEDASANELTIDNTPCRRLGTVKNGESVTFTIGEEATRVYVIADRLSKNLCHDRYDLPAGQEDITLTGRNYFNLASGNAFVFDLNNRPDIAKARHRRMIVGFCVLLAILVVSSLIGSFIGGVIGGMLAPSSAPAHTSAPKTFSSNGMTVTLTDGFRETEAEGFTVAYESRDVAVLALKESFDQAEGFGDLTLREYTDLITYYNGAENATIRTVGEALSFDREAVHPDTAVTYHYTNYTYKTADAFWLIQFAVNAEDIDTYASLFDEWAASIRFT